MDADHFFVELYHVITIIYRMRDRPSVATDSGDSSAPHLLPVHRQ